MDSERIGSPQLPRSETLLSPEAKQKKQEIIAELNLLYAKLNDPESNVGRFGPGGIDMVTVNEIWRLQKENIPQIYKDVSYRSDYLKQHHRQEKQYSCQIATIVNIVEALDGRQISEKDVAIAIGEDSNDNPAKQELCKKFLEDRGYKVSEVWNVLEVIDSLIDGGEIVLPLYPPFRPDSHVVALSGINIDNGKINFDANDPGPQSYAESLSLNHLIEIINPAVKIPAVYSVSKLNTIPEF